MIKFAVKIIHNPKLGCTCRSCAHEALAANAKWRIWSEDFAVDDGMSCNVYPNLPSQKKTKQAPLSLRTHPYQATQKSGTSSTPIRSNTTLTRLCLLHLVLLSSQFFFLLPTIFWKIKNDEGEPNEQVKFSSIVHWRKHVTKLHCFSIHSPLYTMKVLQCL